MISVAVQKGNTVYVYGERNQLLFMKSGGILHGYTGGSVSILNGNTVYTYNEKGSILSSHSAR